MRTAVYISSNFASTLTRIYHNDFYVYFVYLIEITVVTEENYFMHRSTHTQETSVPTEKWEKLKSIVVGYLIKKMKNGRFLIFLY